MFAMLQARGLRPRFIAASALLVLTAVTASLWTLAALSRLSGVVTETVRASEAVTAVTSRLAGALEREDDAVLLVVAADASGLRVLAEERRVADRAVAELLDVLGPEDERELVIPLQDALAAYRRAADIVISGAPTGEALVDYHQRANPLLRRAVSLTTVIRDRHFALARQTMTMMRDEAVAARRAVLVITVVALGVAMLVATQLARTVIGPLRRLTSGANAIRAGRFDQRIDVASRDELGELASAFNEMAADLAEFRRTNVREVVRAKRTLEATLAALPDAVLLFDDAQRIVSMNRAAVDTLAAAGIRAPHGLDDLVLEEFDRAAVTRAITTGQADASPADLSRTIRLDHAGTLRRLLPRVVPLSGQDPEPAGAVLLLYDVTDLARVDELRSELVAVASHELQTPLTTLRMTLLMLEEGAAALPARPRELIATSLLGVDQLSDLVYEFLDLTRIEAGELRLDMEAVSLTALMADAARRVQAQADARAIRLRLRLAPDLPPVQADASRLRIVFDNILSNALTYTPGGGEIVIDGIEEWTPAAGEQPERVGQAGAVAIRITDTGPGVPAAFRSRIFDKFVRLEQHQAGGLDRPRGAGIGLYMCRQIVELHGGRIACTAGPDDRGACFTVTLPTLRPASAPRPASSSPAAIRSPP